MRAAAVLHTRLVGGRRLRFFAPPNSEPALAWLSAGDLVAILAPSRRDAVEWLARLQAGRMRRHFATVTTADGAVVIISHVGAFLVIAHAKGGGFPTTALERHFEAGSVRCLLVRTRDMNDAGAAAYRRAATRAAADAMQAERADATRQRVDA